MHRNDGAVRFEIWRIVRKARYSQLIFGWKGSNKGTIQTCLHVVRWTEKFSGPLGVLTPLTTGHLGIERRTREEFREMSIARVRRSGAKGDAKLVGRAAATRVRADRRDRTLTQVSCYTVRDH